VSVGGIVLSNLAQNPDHLVRVKGYLKIPLIFDKIPIDSIMTRLYLLPLLFLPFLTQGQDGTKILSSAFKKCESIKSASYRSETVDLPIYIRDTLRSTSEGTFIRVPEDTVYGSAFHIRYYFQGNYLSDKLFIGSHFIRYNTKDSTGTIFPINLYAAFIKKHLGAGQLYGLFDSGFRQYFPLKEDSADLVYLGVGRVGEYSCYHFRHSHKYQVTPTNNPAISERIIDLWVNQTDSFPVRFSSLATYLTIRDTVPSYYEETLTSYTLNSIRDSHEFTMSAIPGRTIRIQPFGDRGAEAAARRRKGPNRPGEDEPGIPRFLYAGRRDESLFLRVLRSPRPKMHLFQPGAGILPAQGGQSSTGTD
jgi:hypothetical protein